MKARTPRKASKRLVAKIRKKMTALGYAWALMDIRDFLDRSIAEKTKRDEGEDTQTGKTREGVCGDM